MRSNQSSDASNSLAQDHIHDITALASLFEEAFNNNPPSITQLEKIISSIIDWHTPLTTPPHQGITLIWLFLSAIFKGKVVAVTLFSKLYATSHIHWNAPITDGFHQGKTPLYVLTASIMESIGACGALYQLFNHKVPEDFDWNVQNTATDEYQGATPLYWLIKALLDDSPTAIALLRKINVSSLIWDLPITGEGNDKGMTPLYGLMKAVCQEKKAAIGLFNKINIKQQNWFIAASDVGADQGKTPFYWLVKAVFHEIIAESVLENVLATMAHLDPWFLMLDKLASPEQSPARLWVSLWQLRSLSQGLTAEKNKQIKTLFSQTAKLAKKAYDSGYYYAHLLMIRFLTTYGDDTNALSWFAGLPSDLANFEMVRYYQKIGDLARCTHTAAQIASTSDYFIAAQTAVIETQYALIPSYCTHLPNDSPELRNTKKANNQERRKKIWASFVSTFSLNDLPAAKLIRKNATFLYMYGGHQSSMKDESSASLIPSQSDAELLESLCFQADDHLAARQLLDMLRDARKQEKNKRISRG